MQIRFTNSWTLDPVRNYVNSVEFSRLYLDLILSDIFKRYVPRDDKLEITFFDNQFSNLLCLDIGQLNSILKTKFKTIKYYSDNPLDCSSGLIEYLVTDEVFGTDSRFVKYTRDSGLTCVDPKFKFGFCIQRPDQHRLSLLIELAEYSGLDLFSRIGFDIHTLNVFDYWRQSCGDEVLRQYNLSYRQFCDKLENFTRSDLTDFMNFCVDSHENLNYEQNKNNVQFCLDIVCESHVADGVFITSEKLLRAFMLKQPFVVFSSANFYKNLHRMGFKTFESYWDEEWDSIDQSQMTHKAKQIANTINFIDCNYSINQLMLMSQEIREHNYQRCIELYTDDRVWNDSIQRVING